MEHNEHPIVDELGITGADLAQHELSDADLDMVAGGVAPASLELLAETPGTTIIIINPQ